MKSAVIHSAAETYHRVSAAAVTARRRVAHTAGGRCGETSGEARAAEPASRREPLAAPPYLIGLSTLVGQAETPRREIERDLS